jgi:hypothetical protein
MFRTVKKGTPETRTTLDSLHKTKMQSLTNQEAKLKELEETLTNYEKEYEETDDPIQKTKLETSIEETRREIEKWKDQDPLFSYIFDTGKLLFKYYDIQEKIQSDSQIRHTVRAKPGSVLAALEGESAAPTAAATAAAYQEKKEKVMGREKILEEYLKRVDPENAAKLSAEAVFEDPYGLCDSCGKEMVFSANEALFTCETCGTQEFVLIDSDKPSYKDPPREVTYYAYKRINHFNEWLAQFQAKESTEIPEDVFQNILAELKKERIALNGVIKPTKIKEILKKLKCSNYYDHVPYILNRINGKNAAVMSREVEEKLRFMFKEIQPSFQRHCPRGRCNFLSYGYVLYKFCELLELDEYLQCFPLLKNRDKLYNQDRIWKLICADMRWEYIRSV